MSVVGLQFLKTKLLGVPIPFHRDFPEVNLAVLREEARWTEKLRRGVVFIKEIVPASRRHLGRARHLQRELRHPADAGGDHSRFVSI